MENRKMISFEQELAEHGVLLYPCRGSSMYPLLHERDIVAICRKENQRCRKYDVVLYRRPQGEYVLHRILRVEEKGYWIVGDNCTWGENVREEQILGILTAAERGRKAVVLHGAGYFAYVHFWCAPWRVRFLLLKVRNRLAKCIATRFRTGN